MPDHRLLILFAHPDDEAFPVGGTIAMHTARGVTARLITSTSGELGEIRQAGSATRDTIGEVRRAELAEAIKELGIGSHDVLQYRDSGMAGWDDNHHPKAFVQADEHEVVARLVFEIRRFRPQVILTFGMDGLYGHPDHIAICTHATTAFRLAADPSSFPHHMAIGIQPHQTDRLFYSVRPRGFRVHMAETLQAAGVDFPMPSPDRANDGAASRYHQPHSRCIGWSGRQNGLHQAALHPVAARLALRARAQGNCRRSHWRGALHPRRAARC